MVVILPAELSTVASHACDGGIEVKSDCVTVESEWGSMITMYSRWERDVYMGA